MDQPRDLASAPQPTATAGTDLSVYHFGRGDLQRPEAATRVTFNLSGLSAWAAGDSLQLVSPNTGTTLAGPENELSAYPAAGSTTITGQSLDWKSTLAPLIDAARGDTTLVTQLVARRAGALTYQTIARAGAAAGFTLIDGQPATLTAALAPVAQDEKLVVRWKGSAFAALAPEVGPGARPAAAGHVLISALPEPLARNSNFYTTFYQGLPNLVTFGPLSGTADVDQAIAYGNPFAWSELVTASYAFSVPVPTAVGVGSLSAMMVSAVPAAALAQGGAIAPMISPVRGARINGQPADTARSGLGGAPSLAWDAPATGAVTSYAVVVHEVLASADGVNVRTLGTFHTRSTALQLPASAVAPGHTYMFTITAIAAPGTDLVARPLIGSLPYASADFITAPITL